MAETGLWAEIPGDQRAAAAARLPAMQPVQGPWLRMDSAWAGQVALRRRLLDERPGDVLGQAGATAEVLAETLEHVLAALPAGFDRGGSGVTCPDGVIVPIREDAPLDTLGRILQQDICVLEKRGAEHVLTAACLCFPASWTLAEKLGRPLIGIHAPVAHYDEGIARRVQRLFDGVQAGRPLWRANLLRYDDPALFQPRTEADPRPVGKPDAPWERSERQTVLRLPRTGAVLFVIHTVVSPRGPAS